MYEITHLGEGKTINYSPCQVVIKDLKDPIHVSTNKFVDDITRLYNFDNFELSSIPLVCIAHNDGMRKLWNGIFVHISY